MNTLKINISNDIPLSYFDLYRSGMVNNAVPPKPKRVAYVLTKMIVVASLLFAATFKFGLNFDPEHATQFAFLLAGFTAVIYSLFTTFLERKCAGFGLGFVELNDFGFSKLTSFVTITLVCASLIFYGISIASGYERCEIYGLCTIISLVLSTISWKYHYYYVSWYGNEEDAMVDFEDFSFGKEDMKRYMNELRERKIIR